MHLTHTVTSHLQKASTEHEWWNLIAHSEFICIIMNFVPELPFCLVQFSLSNPHILYFERERERETTSLIQKHNQLFRCCNQTATSSRFKLMDNETFLKYNWPNIIFRLKHCSLNLVRVMSHLPKKMKHC